MSQSLIGNVIHSEAVNGEMNYGYDSGSQSLIGNVILKSYIRQPVWNKESQSLIGNVIHIIKSRKEKQ